MRFANLDVLNSHRHLFAAISNRTIRNARPKTVRIAVKVLLFSLLTYVSNRTIRFDLLAIIIARSVIRITRIETSKFANFSGRSPELGPEPPLFGVLQSVYKHKGCSGMTPSPKVREPHFLWFGLLGNHSSDMPQMMSYAEWGKSP